MTRQVPVAGARGQEDGVRSWRDHVVFLALGLVAALVATWPVWLDPAGRLPGREHPGVLTHVWKFWWTAEAVLDQHTNPAWTHMLHHPRGLEVGYYLASFLDGLWTLPITQLAGPIASYNVFVVLSTATGAWAAMRLAAWLGLARGPSVFVGLAWGLCPYHVGFLYGGAIENLAAPWIPLAVLAILHLMERPRDETSPRRRALVAVGLAACLFLEGLATWYGGLLLACGGGALVALLYALRGRSAQVGALWATAGLLVGGVAVLLAARVLLPTPEPLCSLAETIPTSRTFPPPLAKDLRVTWLLLALAGAATRRGRFWLLLALPFVADMIAAPVVARHVPNTVESDASVASLAVDLVLLDSRRRSLPVHLLLSLSAGHGLAWLVGVARSRGWRRAAGILPLLAIGLWTWEAQGYQGQSHLPTPAFELEPRPHAQFLAEAEPGAVLDLPLLVIQETGSANRSKALRSRFLFDQTVHGRPVLTAVGTRLSYDLCALPLPDPLVEVLHARALGSPRPLPERWDPAAMRRNGYGWVVFHPGLQDPRADRRLERDLGAVLGAPRTFPDGVEVFRVPDGPVDVAPAPVQSETPPTG
ncbi:MAG: hypothetical protein JXB39_00250 [Deltaproteobacteria bacterium]|nr:hypothetical protein [Deltaproteobacteria bacterium]